MLKFKDLTVKNLVLQDQKPDHFKCQFYKVNAFPTFELLIKLLSKKQRCPITTSLRFRTKLTIFNLATKSLLSLFLSALISCRHHFLNMSQVTIFFVACTFRTMSKSCWLGKVGCDSMSLTLSPWRILSPVFFRGGELLGFRKMSCLKFPPCSKVNLTPYPL